MKDRIITILAILILIAMFSAGVILGRQCSNIQQTVDNQKTYEQEKEAADELNKFKQETDDIRSNTDVFERRDKARELLRSVIEQ